MGGASEKPFMRREGALQRRPVRTGDSLGSASRSDASVTDSGGVCPRGFRGGSLAAWEIFFGLGGKRARGVALGSRVRSAHRESNTVSLQPLALGPFCLLVCLPARVGDSRG